MKLANHAGRAALVLDDGGRRRPRRIRRPLRSRPDERLRRLAGVRRLRGHVTAGTAPLVEADLGCPVPAPAAGVRHRPQLPEPRRGVRHGAARRCRPRSRSSRLAVGALRRHRDRRRHRRLGGRARRRDRHAAPTASPRPTRGRTSPASPSARTSATARSSSPPARSSRSASPAAATDRWGRGWSRSTRCRTPTTSRSAARSTARRCRTPRTSDLIFGVPRLIAELSASCRSSPATSSSPAPPPVSVPRRQPARFLQPGQVLETWIEGIGTIRNRCV